MDTTTEPTTYTNAVARFPLGSEDDPDSVLLARLMHARTTRVGVTYLSLTDAQRDTLRCGAAHIINAVGEAMRAKLGSGAHAIIREALEASFLDGDCCTILRNAEDGLDRAIMDDHEFRSRKSETEAPSAFDVLAAAAGATELRQQADEDVEVALVRQAAAARAEDDAFGARGRLKTLDGTAAPSELCNPRPESTTVGDHE